MATKKHSDAAMDKPLIRNAVHKHESAMHPGKPMTKLKKGGVTSLEMKKYGRNLARAMNQKSSSRGR